MTSVMDLQQVTKVFGQRCILKDVSLSIPAGSLILLMGANGAGKSTLLRIMAGLAKPTFGEVHSHITEKELGYLGHATFVYPGLTARENLAFWGNMYDLKNKDQAIEEVLNRVELLPYAHEKAGVFSRGMTQRLNLARVLLLQPRLWLLDEPSTGLDVRSGDILRKEVLRAKTHGAAIVWISHDVHNDGSMADSFWHLEKARVTAQAAEGQIC